MTDKVKKAYDMAKWAHETQTRKFTGNPYFDEHVEKVWEETKRYGATEDEECAALLHDVVEDQKDKVSLDDIKKEFGEVVSNYVSELTSDDNKIKEIGKAEYLKDKLSKISLGALKIKLADRKCNISDLMTAPDKFRNKYYPETRKILEGLNGRKLEYPHKMLVRDINNILDDVKAKYYENSKYKPKHIKMFEVFKQKNISLNDIINCIESGGVIYSDNIRNLQDHDIESPIHPISVDNDGLITVEINGTNYEINIDDVEKIEYKK